MNPYLQPNGFLGTGASLLADVTVLAYILLIIPGMLVGFVFARRKMFRPYHKWTMTTILIVNWILIIFLMITAYRFDVIWNFPNQPDNTRYLIPAIHGLIGLVAQLLATYVIFRMFREDALVKRAKARGEKDTSRYWFKRAKPIMRLTLTLWLITSVLGVVNYLTRYDIIPTYHLGGKVAAPIVTPEVTVEPPVASPEVIPPAATVELTVEAPVVTEEMTIGAPVATEEVSVEAPVATKEASPEAPVATREVVPPIASPEVVAPVTTPEVTPSRTPRAPATTPEASVG